MVNIQTLPSANQIWYTSSDGAVINPSARYFSARLVSNTYEQGWGVITFNKPLTDIGWNAFFECKTLKSVVFPLGVVEIANGVCKGCTALDKVVIPDSVTKIVEEAFSHLSTLSSIVIPKGVKKIESCAFNKCCNLDSITLPVGVNKIDENAFHNCNGIQTIYVPAKKTDYYKQRLNSNLHDKIVEIESVKL